MFGQLELDIIENHNDYKNDDKNKNNNEVQVKLNHRGQYGSLKISRIELVIAQEM